MRTFKSHLLLLFEQTPDTPLLYKRIDNAIYALILLSSAGVILETLPIVKLQTAFFNFLLRFETFAMTIFIVEVALRIWVTPEIYRQCHSSWERFIMFLYLLIDILAIIPALLFAFGSEHHDYFLTLRLLRLFKVFRHDDSIELVLRAIILKRDILGKTALIVLIMTIFLAVLIYEAENKFEFNFNISSQTTSAPTRFTDIGASLVWCFSMYVGDLAGYMESGFMPTTPLGRFFAGILGFLNVAIVIIPTGIIASGFLEVLEEKKINKQYQTLVQAFRPKYNPVLGINLYERPRTLLTLQNALYIHENAIFRILETKPAFRMRAVQSDEDEKYSDTNLVEYYGYGTLTKYGVKRVVAQASLLVICPDSFACKGVGYFSYAISEIFKASLVSNELFQENSLNKLYDTSFVKNKAFVADWVPPHSPKELKKVPLSDIALYQFKKDIQELAPQKSVFVFLADSHVPHFSITPLHTLAPTELSELLQWLAQKNKQVYVVSLNSKQLDNYYYYELIREVAQAMRIQLGT